MPAEIPPPAEAMAPKMRWVKAEFLYSEGTEGDERRLSVLVTELVRKRASIGQKMVLRTGGFRSYCKAL